MAGQGASSVWLRCVRRLLTLVGLAWGVFVLLFLILESGLTGDPARRALGKQASQQALGQARVNLGYYRSYVADAFTVQWNGAPGRVILQDNGTELLVLDLHDQSLASVPYGSRPVVEFIAELEQVRLPGGQSFTVRLNPNVPRPHLPELAVNSALPARGLGAALHGGRVAIDSRRPIQLGWADARSPLTRLLHQSARLLSLDLGRSLDGQAVSGELLSRAGRSLALTLPAFITAILAAYGLALLAVRRGGRADRMLLLLAAIVVAVTPIAWILALRQLFAVSLEWFPVAATAGLSLTTLALPALIWAWVAAWPEFQVARSLLRDASRSPHVLAARARGIDEARIWRRHVFRVCAAHFVAQLALAIPFLVLGSLILERVFVIPGLGSYLVDAAQRSDPAVLRACTFALALVYLLCQELGEWGRKRLDPRLQTSTMDAA